MSINITVPTASQRRNALIASAGVATGVIAVFGLGGCANPGRAADAAGVDLVLAGESTLHEFAFPVRSAFDGPRAIADVPLPDPMALTPSAAAFDERLQPYRLTKEEALVLSPMPQVNTEDTDPRDPSAGVVTTDALAALLAAGLQQVEAVEVDDSVDPSGYTVTVDVGADGVAGVPLLVIWSLSGADVRPPWNASHLGARFVPTTDDDASVDIWIPALRTDGDYTLDVSVVDADGAAVTSGSLAIEDTDASGE